MRYPFLLIIVLMSFDSFSQKTEKEDFTEFLTQFSVNQNFQIERVKFPLPFKTWKDFQNGIDTTIFLTKDSWEMESLWESKTKFYTQIFNNFKKELEDTDERVFSYLGIENGISVYLYFKRIDGKWFLIKKEDLSS